MVLDCGSHQIAAAATASKRPDQHVCHDGDVRGHLHGHVGGVRDGVERTPDRGAPSINVRFLRETKGDTLQYRITAYLRADIQLAHPAAFCVATGIRA